MNTREDERHLIAQLAGKSLYHRLNHLPKSLTELSDSELVTAYLDGNTAAFTVIISRYYRLMLWVAHKYTDRIIDAEDLRLLVEIDGGINADTIEEAAEAGIDCFVAGSAVYRADDALAAICELREAAASHCHGARG